ncbi:hypothetical protein Aduo_002831 [Ancylostoma duodenale]
MWTGLAAALVASVFFGSVFVPIKKVYAGDGFTAQLFVGVGVYTVGIIVHATQGFPGFYPFAMLGGFVWAFANAFAMQIINRLGMGLTNLTWNTISCTTGWATSRFGLLGLTAAIPASLGLNYLGVAVLIAGGVMYSFVKNNAQRRPGREGRIEGGEVRLMLRTPELKFMSLKTWKTKRKNSKEENDTTIEDIPQLERVLSFISAMVSGLFYGTMWLPVNYMMANPDKFPDTPKEPLPYIFSFGCGVLSTTTVVFIVYAIAKRNHPWVSGETAIPAFSTGVVFGCAMTAFVVAIDKLDAAIAYPICQMAPGLAISLWSVLYYKEISGRRNLLILAAAYCLTVAGVALVTISREIHVF